MPPRAYTIREVAAQLGVTRQRVHALLRSRGLQPQRHALGGYLLSAREIARLRRRRPGRPRKTVDRLQ